MVDGLWNKTPWVFNLVIEFYIIVIFQWKNFLSTSLSLPPKIRGLVGYVFQFHLKNANLSQVELNIKIFLGFQILPQLLKIKMINRFYLQALTILFYFILPYFILFIGHNWT